jgi:hypothetical protein
MKQVKGVIGISVVGLVLCMIAALTQAQAPDINSGDKNLLGWESNAKNFSLLDPQRLKMYHSYTFSYFSNSQTSGSFGVYTTTLNYQLSKPLSLTLSLNYLHQPLSVFGQNNLRVKDSILPNFQLHYRPSSSFSLWINVLTYPTPYSSGYRNPWWEYER